MEGVGEGLGRQEVGAGGISRVVRQDRAQHRLLGLEIVQRFALTHGEPSGCRAAPAA